MLLALTVASSNLFVYCFFGKMATESFEKMANSFYESNWTKLSVESQAYFLVMITNAQRPIHYHGFGMAVLNLETFCKVRQLPTLIDPIVFLSNVFSLSQTLRTVFSYFMLFKTVTSH